MNEIIHLLLITLLENSEHLSEIRRIVQSDGVEGRR